MSDYMDYVIYSNIDVTNQVLTSADWDIDIDFGNEYMVYHPSVNFIKQRLLSIEGVSNAAIPNHTLIEIPMRAWTYLQPGWTETKPVEIQFKFQDFEDQSIKTWQLDWINKCDSMITHRAFPRKSVILPGITIKRLNVNRQVVWEINCRNGIINSPNYTESYTGIAERNKIGECTMNIRFERLLPSPETITADTTTNTSDDSK